VFSYLWGPTSYLVKDDKLVINRKIGNVVLPLNEIVSAKEITREDYTFAIRYIGNAGFCGWYGRFWSPKLGNLKFFASQKKNLVLIETIHKGKWVISPDDLSLVNLLIKK
jgi:hypothetical protein